MRPVRFPKLPLLWSNRRLDEVAEVIMGQSPPGDTYNNRGEGLPFYQGKTDFGQNSPTPRVWCTSPKRIAEKDDILISVRAPVGAINLADEQCCIGRGLSAIRSNSDIIDISFLQFYLRYMENYLSTAGYGSTFQSINKDDLLSLNIPLPLIQEQERIVHILRQLEKLKNLRYETLNLAQELFQAVFFEMFGDPIVNPNGYPIVRLDEFGILERGVSKHRPRDAGFLFNGPYPFIQTGDVTNSGGWITKYSQTYSEDGLEQSRLWPKGTLCITIAANIAKTGILTFDACFPDSIVGFVPNKDVTTEFVKTAVDLFQKKLETQAPQAAQKNINLEILRTLRIPKPPFDLQQKYSSIVNQINLNMMNIRHSRDIFEKLEKQIRAEAFCGDLTANWREKNKHKLLSTAKQTEISFGGSIKTKERAPDERPWLSQPRRHWLIPKKA
jgi:type I restriction enzyme S subunit